MKHKSKLAAMVVFLMLAAGLAQADTIGYTDYNAWAARTTGATTITFNGLAEGTVAWDNTSAGLTVDGVNFVGGEGPGVCVGAQDSNGQCYFLAVIDPIGGGAPGWYDWGSGDVLHGLGGPDSGVYGWIDVTLPGGITSVSFDLATLLPYGSSVQVTLSDGSHFLVNTSDYPTPTFFGITSTDPITGLRIGATGTSFINVDNFSFGQDPPPAENPEPATLGLLGLGFSAIAWRVKRR